MTTSSVLGWLDPIRSAVPELQAGDWESLSRLDELLSERMPAGRCAGPASGPAWLLDVRADLARHGYARLTCPRSEGGQGRPAVLQALLQFVCGYYDLDLRDATGLGHGAMVSDLAPAQRRLWMDQLAAGGLVGIAATERHGGSRVREITARAGQSGARTWSLYGEKTWVSRLFEAAAFVVFFRDPEHHLSAALIDASHPGLQREPMQPAGLAGWSWGTFRLQNVEFDTGMALIGGPGKGDLVFERHFTRYRPLVCATALGAAAAVHDEVSRTLMARRRIGVIHRIRDNAYIALGNTYGEVCQALLMALQTVRLADQGHPGARVWARAGKAGGVDAARRAVAELAPLVGASGFLAESRLIKVRDDLAALAYADGIHDSLYRSAGQHLLGSSGAR